jgi:hypothetical protein
MTRKNKNSHPVFALNMGVGRDNNQNADVYP